MPCKQFFAVFRHHPEWGWEKLPRAYRCSSILSLDEPIIVSHAAFKFEDTSMFNTSPETGSPETGDPETDSPETAITSGPEMDAFLQVRKGSCRNIGSECSECRELRNITFTVVDTEVLAELKKGLAQLHDNLKAVAPADGGLLLESSQPKARKEKLQAKSTALRFQSPLLKNASTQEEWAQRESNEVVLQGE